MSKMREAWEKHMAETAHEDTSYCSFYAGYQAAIEAVKAGGAVGRVAIDKYPFVADTYKLPEDV